MRAMDLHSIKSGLFGVLCREPEHLHIPGNFFGAECARDFIGFRALGRVGRLIADGLGTAGHWLLTTIQQRVRGTARMPNLHEDAAAFSMERVGHTFPTRHMCGAVNPAFTHERTGMDIDHRTFRHDEAARRTL